MSTAPTAPVSLHVLRGLIAEAQSLNRTFVARDRLLAETQAAAPVVRYDINVSNTGSVDSDDVVLGFLTPPGAGTKGVPLNVLFGFARVRVPAGDAQLVELYPDLLEFSQVCPTVCSQCYLPKASSMPRAVHFAKPARAHAYI
eukprot:SAG31_NODE_54_length_29987_cov_4.570664_16_plen_143_part_00